MFNLQLKTLTLVLIISPLISEASSPFSSDDFVKVAGFHGTEIQKTELTRAQYAALELYFPPGHSRPWEFCAQPDYSNYNPSPAYGPNYPANCISSQDAKIYIETLNANSSDYKYRLPRDGEFTFLIEKTLDQIGAEKFEFPSSEIQDHFLLNFAFPRVVGFTKPILGLSDIIGNLLEWSSQYSGGPGKYLRGGDYDGSSPYHRAEPDDTQRYANVGLGLVRSRK